MRGPKEGTVWTPPVKIPYKKARGIEVLTDEEKRSVYALVSQYHDLQNQNNCSMLQSVERKLARAVAERQLRSPSLTSTAFKRKWKKTHWYKTKVDKKPETFSVITENDQDDNLWLKMSLLSETVCYTQTGPDVNEYETEQPQLTPPVSSTQMNGQQEPFEGIENEVGSQRFHDDSRDVSITYLGTTELAQPMSTNTQCDFNISPDSLSLFTIKGTDITGKLLIDSGASKSYMTKDFYLSHPVLHSLPKYQTAAKGVIVGNGTKMTVLFAIPVIITVGKHNFEVFTIVADLAGGFDVVFGMKNLIELEGIIDVRNLKFSFQNRSSYLYPSKPFRVTKGQSKIMEVELRSDQEVTGYVVAKLFAGSQTRTLKLKFYRNKGHIRVTHAGEEPIITLETGVAIGIVDLRSIGYFHITGAAIMDALRDEVHFEDANTMCDHVNRLIQEVNRENKTKFSAKQHDPFPWLEDDDWRKTATDAEILEGQVDLTEAHMSPAEKKQLRALCLRYKEAFSLRDEVGECPNIKVHLELHDKTPFFVRPFRVNEEDKPFMDRQMERLVQLGVLTKRSTSHTSPVMLLSRKLTKDKRVVVDFRQLNTRVIRRNTTTPLLRDILTTLGRHPVEIFSCIDFKDAYHSMRLDEESKEYCGIVPYYGAPAYRFERMPMGLSISPAMWMEYVTILLDGIEHKDRFLAIMDDMVIHSVRNIHFPLIEELFQAVIKHGLKISPRKCQFFVKQMVFMGNAFNLEDTRITVTPLKSRCETIVKMMPPKDLTESRSFCGMVNFLSMFCKNLIVVLKPIYDVTRKGQPFFWGEKQQKAFNEVKKMLIKPPVLTLPSQHGRFILCVDTSRTSVGTALWQYQGGVPRLIGYASKTLVEAAKNYSVTLLEMTGLVTGLQIWSHFLNKREIDVVTDHQAAVYILKAKKKPPNERIARMVEEAFSHSIKVYYMKGKDMILADSLSRLNIPDDDGPENVVPIAVEQGDFEPVQTTEIDEELRNNEEVMKKAFPPKYDLETMKPEKDSIQFLGNALLNFGETPTIIDLAMEESGPMLMVMTRSKAAADGVQLPEVHGVKKTLDPAKRPEKQRPVTIPKPPKIPDPVIETPHMPPPNLPTADVDRNPYSEEQKETPLALRGENDRNEPDEWVEKLKQAVGSEPFEVQQPPSSGDVEVQQRLPQPQDLREPLALAEQVDLTKVVQRRLPRQKDLNKLIQQIERKILHQVHLTSPMKDIKAQYYHSPHFRRIYTYLMTGKTSGTKKQVSATLGLSNHFFVLDELLFKIIPTKGDDKAVLCLPSSLLPELLSLYHSSVFASHAGITKCLATLNERFFIPDVAKHVRAYILGCHTCQTFKDNQLRGKAPLSQRVTVNTPAVSRFSMDIKHMPPGIKGYHYILVMCCEMSNFIVACPLRTTQSPEICMNIIAHWMQYFAMPTHIICDQDPAFLSSLSQYFHEQFKIKVKVCGPTNHKSLKAESAIKSLSHALMKHLHDKGDLWPIYLPFAVMTCNTFHTPNLDGFCPFQLVTGRLPRLIPDYEIDSEITVSATFQQYYELLQKQLKYLRERLHHCREKKIQLQNQYREFTGFKRGQLVYLYHPLGADLQTGSQKIRSKFVGPLVIYMVLDANQYVLMTLDGDIFPNVIESTRLKPGFIATAQGKVETLSELIKVLRAPKF